MYCQKNNCQTGNQCMMNSGCSCSQGNVSQNWNACCNQQPWNGCCNSQPWNMMNTGVTPLVAPRRVCVQNSFTPVEQPVICPIECRQVNHPVMYPRFYPVYEHTFYSQSQCCNCNQQLR